MNLFCFVSPAPASPHKKWIQALPYCRSACFVCVCVSVLLHERGSRRERRAGWRASGRILVAFPHESETQFEDGSTSERRVFQTRPFLSEKCQHRISYSLSVSATSGKSPASQGGSISRMNYFGLSAELQQPGNPRRFELLQPIFFFFFSGDVRPKLWDSGIKSKMLFLSVA